MKYCALSAQIAFSCFQTCAAQMDGDYATAMSHRVTGGTPVGWTAAHILCNGSDVGLLARDVVEALLNNGIVDMKAFDSAFNDQVIVFFLSRL